MRPKDTPAALVIGGTEVPPGRVRQLDLAPAADCAAALPLSVTVVRGARPGPRVFLTGGVHGDEVNGVAIVREVSRRIDPERLAGDLLCVPVVNRPGFRGGSRYLPDGSDLNRCFPGAPSAGAAERLANLLMREVVLAADYGIDFHTAARGRSNVPHVRGDMNRPGVRLLAKAFGTPIVIHKVGHPRSLRRSATEAGVPTITLEAGETGRFARRIGRAGLRGVQNVLAALGMLQARRERPPFQIILRRSAWVRAEGPGRTQLAVGPGQLVYAGQPIATHAPPQGRVVHSVVAPLTGLVIGVSLGPISEPGSALCHIARLRKTLRTVERHLQAKA